MLLWGTALPVRDAATPWGVRKAVLAWDTALPERDAVTPRGMREAVLAWGTALPVCNAATPWDLHAHFLYEWVAMDVPLVGVQDTVNSRR